MRPGAEDDSNSSAMRQWTRDQQTIAETIVDFLKPGGSLRATAGELKEFFALRESVESRNLTDVTWSAPEIRSLDVTRVTTTEASAQLDATVSYTGRSGLRHLKGRATYNGPVELVHAGDQWKVADITRNGVSVLTTLIPGGLSATADGLTLTVVGGQIAPSAGIFLCVEVKNARSAPVRLGDVAVGWLAEEQWRWAIGYCATTKLLPGETRFEVGAHTRGVPLGASVRLVADTKLGTIDLRPPSAPAQLSVPSDARSMSTAEPLIVGCLAALTGVLTNAGGAALALSLWLIMLLARVLRGEPMHRRATRWGLAAAVAALALYIGGGWTEVTNEGNPSSAGWLVLVTVAVTAGFVLARVLGLIRPLRPRELSVVIAAYLAVIGICYYAALPRLYSASEVERVFAAHGHPLSPLPKKSFAAAVLRLVSKRPAEDVFVIDGAGGELLFVEPSIRSAEEYRGPGAARRQNVVAASLVAFPGTKPNPVAQRLLDDLP